jgi:hypothetical protein
MSDPQTEAAKVAAAKIARSFEQTMARFENRARSGETATRNVQPRARDESPEWIAAANRMTQLPPVRRSLTRAQRKGKHAYVTTLDGVPIAFMPSGWCTQGDADAHLAKLRKGGR